ncbi:hypothetical protein, partial [Streptomyces nigra]
TEWPELKVHCTSVTEQWATVALVGPRSRAVLPKKRLAAPAYAPCFGSLLARIRVLDMTANE